MENACSLHDQVEKNAKQQSFNARPNKLRTLNGALQSC